MPTDGKVLAVVPARWASTRFPGKPLADILGKPMVQWIVEQAGKASLVTKVVVATDDQRIYDAVQSFGGNAVMTSLDHQSGSDRAAEVAKNLECDIVVNVQGDEPLIHSQNIDLVIKPLLGQSDFPVSTLMIAIRDRNEMIDSNTCKVVVDNNGRALYFTRAPVPYDRDPCADDVHVLKDDDANSRVLGYKHIGLYAYTKSFLLQFPKLKASRLEVESLPPLPTTLRARCSIHTFTSLISSFPLGVSAGLSSPGFPFLYFNPAMPSNPKEPSKVT